MTLAESNALFNSTLQATTVTGTWFVLHTRAQQERRVDEFLKGIGAQSFLPLVEKTRYQGKRKFRGETPLFPGYVFLHGSREQAFEADRTRRLVQILDVPNQQELQDQLGNIRLALASEEPVLPYPGLSEGVLVRMKGGPLDGVVGRVDCRTGRDRLVLQIDMLGQAISFETDCSLVEIID